MGFNASLNQNSAIGSAITFTPDVSSEGGYTVSSFTAPKKGVYRFNLKGSGGSAGRSSGGAGGKTVGYLLLEKNQTVYVGAGGPCSAAFVSGAYGDSLAAVASGQVLLVAGGGGAGGWYNYNHADHTYCTAGGNGGGTSGGAGTLSGNGTATPGGGGTKSSGGAAGTGEYASNDGYDYYARPGAYGVGGAGAQDENSTVGWVGGGRGGDGYYGGGGGGADASGGDIYAMGGGGGSGYVYAATLTVAGKTYTSATTQGGGAASGNNGSVVVTYYARAQLPIYFNGGMLERLFFNGTEVGSLVYNGTKLFFRRIFRRGTARCGVTA